MSERKEEPDRLVRGYEIMLEYVAAPGAAGQVRDLIDRAKEKAMEIGELSREEVERLGDYLRRDLEAAGQFLAETGDSLGDWLRFDLRYLEEKMLELIASAADRTRVEWARLAGARAAPEWRTGEVAGVGTLTCVSCGHEVALHAPGRVPECPTCKATVFQRD